MMFTCCDTQHLKLVDFVIFLYQILPFVMLIKSVTLGNIKVRFNI